MKKEIQYHILSIQKTIKDFSEGFITFQEAHEEYNILLAGYQELKKKTNSNNINYLKGLCYNHNVDNFSIFSGIYIIKNNTIKHISIYGEQKIHEKLLIITNKNIEKIITSEKLLKFAPEETALMSQNIYIQSITKNYNEIFFFAAVSSSAYFSATKFNYYTDILNDLFMFIHKNQNAIDINYFDDILKDMKDYITENVDDEFIISSHLFYLRNIEKIFFHKGMKSLIEISNYIVKRIRETYPEDSKIYVLSLREYVVMFSSRRDSDSPNKKRNIEFYFDGIKILHQRMRLTINNIEELYKFLKEVSLFENYILKGEVMS